MQMPGGPGQHGKRHGEIVVVSGWAFIDCTALTLLDLECRKLFESPNTFGTVSKTDPMVSQLGEQEFEQEGPANVIDRDNAMSDLARLARRAIARATDLQANDARTEGVEQRFTVAGVVA